MPEEFIQKQESVWKRLTRLFRSGPVVRHKIATGEKLNEPRGTARAYKKELSSLYVHSLASYGQYERLSRYADYCFHPDTIVYTTLGAFSIKELAEKYGNGERFQVYSYDHDQKRVIIADAHSPRLKHDGKLEELVELRLDDGGSIKLTPDHRVLLRDGSEKKAEDVVSGDRLMPFYKKDLIGQGYQWIYTMRRDAAYHGWELEHRLVAEYTIGRRLFKNEVVHHKDFHRDNNLPSNLAVMDDHDHRSYHAKLNNKNKLGKPNQKHSEWMRKGGSHRREDVNFPAIVRAATQTDYNFAGVCDLLKTDRTAVKLRLREHGINNWTHFCSLRSSIETGITYEVIKRESSVTWQQVLDNHLGCSTIYELSSKIGCTEKSIMRRVCGNGHESWTDFKLKMDPGYDPKKRYRPQPVDYQNHQVVSVQRCTELSTVYNITVEEHHNLAAGSRVIDAEGKEKLSLCFYWQSEMEFTPEIASALDIYADETTSYNEQGQILGISSDDEELKQVLETLFFDILNIDYNIWSWTRNLCKYGDFILFVDAAESNGILNLLPIPINEIEREEGYDKEDPFAVRFRWLTQGNMILENWQIVHVRLLGNDNFLPYGSSIIEPSRRIWRQLILIEDAMLVYRLVRSPERRVFKIDVGNIPPDQVEAFMEQVKTSLRRTQVVDPSSGRVDLRYNPLSVDEDYFLPVRGDRSSTIETLAGGQFPVRRDTLIPLLDGRVITIEELAGEFAAGKENWVHSVQDGTHAFVPGKVVWCGKNYTCDKLRRVWLDDGTYIDMAPEHPIVMRDGTKKRADQVQSGESVMPFRTKRETIGKYDYDMIQDPTDDVWKFVHRQVAGKHGISAAIDRSAEHDVVIHHVDFDRFNNRPDNLRWMGRLEHIHLHGENAKRNLHTPEMDAKNAQRMTEFNQSFEGRALTVAHNSTRWGDVKFRADHSGENHWNVKKWASIYDKVTPERLWYFCTLAKIKTFKELVEHPDAPLASPEQFRACLRYHGIDSWSEFARERLDVQPQNHTILKVETLEGISDDVYCMTVVGPDGEHDRHNFAARTRDADGAMSNDVSGCFLWNTGDIDDVQYIQNKLFAALKIPKAYLGYEGELGSKATLAQQDVRFARTIERIQRIVISELNKIAIIHLFLLGYSGADLVNFELKLAGSSVIFEQQKLELWRTRFEVASSAGEGILDRETIYERIFNLSDRDIEKIKEGKKADKLEDLVLESMQAPATEGEEGAEGEGGGEEGGGEEAPVPGEEELPDTLGGPPGGEEAGGEAPEGDQAQLPAPEGVTHGPVLAEEPEVTEKRNKGSEGNQAELSVSKGKDLFSTGEDQKELAFGTKKQTASDPYDLRALHRLVKRPFGEGRRRRSPVISKKIFLHEEASGEMDAEFRGSIERTRKIEKEAQDILNRLAKIDWGSSK